MKIKEIIQFLEKIAPLNFQESYDNSGLIVGNRENEVTSALVCLDSTEEVVDEAIENRCNLIISHHPVIFSGIKKFTEKSYVREVFEFGTLNNINAPKIKKMIKNKIPFLILPEI